MTHLLIERNPRYMFHARRCLPALAVFAVAIFVLLGFSSTSKAATATYSIDANGVKEVTAGGVPGQGDADGSAVGTLTLDNGTGSGTTGSATFSLALANLDFPLTGFHIHNGAATTTGPIIIDFGNPENFRTGSTLSGTVSNLSAANISSVLAAPGNFYLNIHNISFPGGAVRDQLTAGLSVVNTTGDHDDGTCDANDCTLREAIDAANSAPGVATIAFNITTPAKTITIAAPLPNITDTVTIDGTTQPGFAGVPLIELTAGPDARPPLAFGACLTIVADDCVVRGMVINHFASGITIAGSVGHLLAQRNHIEGCYIGTDLNGAAVADLGNGVGIIISHDGFSIGSGAVDNVVGGNTPGSGNVISGNGDYGIIIAGSNTTGNTIAGNLIGTDATGNAAAPNGRFGVAVFCSGNTIGGTTAGARNVISGHPENGVWLVGAGSTNNLVQGNYIGTNINASAGIPNGLGVSISDDSGIPGTGATNNTIGGTAPGAGNVISGNAGDGIAISGTSTTGNIIQGNIVGLNATSTGTVPNIDEGIVISAPNTTIGGMAAGARNVIAGNFFNGIDLAVGATGTVIQGNYLGTDVNGTSGFGNGGAGVQIADAGYNLVGGSASGSGNLISANANYGVIILGTGSVGNVVCGNTIGAQQGGLIPLGNGEGVRIVSASDNTIGGTSPGEGNIIVGNAGNGVSIILAAPDHTATGNSIVGNRIGLDAAGDNMANGSDGVFLGGLVNGNTIGGTTSEARNFISGNLGNGVEILGDSNQVQGNYIGTGLSGVAAAANGLAGVALSGSNNVIGGTTAGATNIIAFNNNAGVAVPGGTGNVIWANSIFSNGGIGIDLNVDGVSVNDANDGDTGPNTLQNFPVLTRALHFNTRTRINGTLNSTVTSTFQLDFYANSPGGARDGRIYLGATDVTTDGSGNATYEFSSAVNVSVGNEVTATATDATGNTSEFSAPLVVTVTQSIGGYVRTNTLAPIANVSIALNPVPGGVTSPVLTDTEGFYLFTDVPDGNYSLTATKTGWSFSPAIQNLSVNGASRGANFTGSLATPTFAISGRVSNGVSGIAGITVALSPTPDGVPGQVITNSAGYYLFRNVPPDSYTVTPQVSGIGVAPAARVVTIVNADSPGQNFVLGVRVSGRIVDSGGSGIAGVSVLLNPFGPGLTGVTNPVLTNTAGYYTFIGVPQGRFVLSPSRAGFTFIPVSRQIDVDTSDLTNQNFLGRSGFTIQGRISTSAGVGISGVVVQLDGGATATSNSAGYYTLFNVSNGVHVLSPSRSGFSFVPVQRTVDVDSANLSGQNFIGTGP